MAVERLYTLPELAEKTGRSYWFWDAEIRAGRLKRVQSKRGGTRYVSESHYDEWFLASLGQPQQQEERIAAAVAPPVTGDPWVDFDP